MDPHRSERVAEALRAELEEILNYELDDPRVSAVGVTEVVLSPDRKKAHVRLALAGTAPEQRGCLEAIEKAKGYVRHLLSERLEMYRLPDLRFDSDLPPELRDKAAVLLRKARRGRPRGEDGEKIEGQ